MDYKKLAEDLLSGCEENCADCGYAGDSEFECTIAQLAATAITDLLARAEKEEKELVDCREKNAGLALALLTEQPPNTDCLGDMEWKEIRIRVKEAETRAKKAEKEVDRLRESLDFARTKDAEIVRLGNNLSAEKARAEKAEGERDAAVSDLETVMAYGGGSLDTCQFCKNGQCYKRGGAKPCLPKWRGQKEE